MWPNPQFPAYLVILTEEILNGKLHFWCSDVPDHEDVQYDSKQKTYIKISDGNIMR